MLEIAFSSQAAVIWQFAGASWANEHIELGKRGLEIANQIAAGQRRLPPEVRTNFATLVPSLYTKTIISDCGVKCPYTQQSFMSAVASADVHNNHLCLRRLAPVVEDTICLFNHAVLSYRPKQALYC